MYTATARAELVL